MSEYGGVAIHNARRLAKEIYARIPLIPQSFFLNGADVSIEGGDGTKGKYQGTRVKILTFSWPSMVEVSAGIPRVLPNKRSCPESIKPNKYWFGPLCFTRIFARC